MEMVYTFTDFVLIFPAKTSFCI